MSVEELIDFAKALTPDEQQRLVRAVEKDRFTKLERQFAEMFPPGFVAEVWFPDANGEAAAALQTMLDELKAKPS
jgi:hypothetical protein